MPVIPGRGLLLALGVPLLLSLVVLVDPATLTPMLLADRARAMAAESGLECEVLDQDRMRQLGNYWSHSSGLRAVW
jgi:leucyl aminopeptidase